MNNRIAQALTKLFERHRIVFWYDAGQELRGNCEPLEPAGIKLISRAGLLKDGGAWARRRIAMYIETLKTEALQRSSTFTT